MKASLPARLQLLRETLGYSRQQLACRALGPRAAANNIGRIERGVHNATLVTLEKIARGLGVSAKFLLEGYPRSTGKNSAGWQINEGFPARMQRAMMEQELTFDALGARLEFSNISYLVDLARGRFCPRPETVLNLAAALDINAELLATGKVTRKKALDELSRGERLLLVRKASGLSRRELAQLAGTTHTYGAEAWRKIGIWECRNTRPPLAELKRIADALGVSLTWLWQGSLNPEAQALSGQYGALLPKPLADLDKGISLKSQKFLDEVRSLLAMEVLTEKDITQMSHHFRQILNEKIIKAAREADKLSTIDVNKIVC